MALRKFISVFSANIALVLVCNTADAASSVNGCDPSQQTDIITPSGDYRGIFDITVFSCLPAQTLPENVTLRTTRRTPNKWISLEITVDNAGQNVLVKDSGRISVNNESKIDTFPLSRVASKRIKLNRWAPGFTPIPFTEGIPGTGGGEAFIQMPPSNVEVYILVDVKD